jgi:hypothetical protein
MKSEDRQEVRMAELQQQLEEVRAGVKAATGQLVTSPRAGCDTEVAEAAGAQRLNATEAGPGTTRKAVEQPPPSASTLAPKRLKMKVDEHALTDGGFDEWLAAQGAID